MRFTGIGAKAFLLAATFVAAQGLVGCGDEDEALTVQDYFERMGEIGSDLGDAAAEIEAKLLQVLDDDGSDEGDVVRAARDFFESSTDARRDVLNSALRLTPPADLASIHDAFTASLDVWLGQFQDIADQVEDAETIDDIGAADAATDQPSSSRRGTGSPTPARRSRRPQATADLQSI